MCESMIVYILFSTCQWVHIELVINRPGYPHDVWYWWETFTHLFLSNIINHGESDVQWQFSISGSHLSVLWD